MKSNDLVKFALDGGMHYFSLLYPVSHSTDEMQQGWMCPSCTDNTDWCLGVQQFWLYTAPMYTSSIHQKICGLIIPPVWPTAILSNCTKVMKSQKF